MAAWLAALCRLLTTLLVISLFFNYMFQDSLKLETDRLGVGFSEFMAVLTTPSTPFDKQVLRRSGKTDAIGIPISRKLALGVRLVNMALITNLLLLANDVATNPGPTQTSAHFSSCDSSFSSCFSNESFVSDSSAVSDNEDSVLSTYYDLGLGDRGLRLGHWNVNYLTMAKFEEIKLCLLNADGKTQLDILFLSETFLKASDSDTLYSAIGFNTLRRDRMTNGGGILALVNNELEFKSRMDLEQQGIESIWLEVSPYKSNRSLIIGCVYRPPNQKKQLDIDIEEHIERIHLLNKETIFRTDINIDYKNRPKYDNHRLIKGLRNMHFKQLVDFITRPVSKTCLDHVYSNQPQRISSVSCHNIGLADHVLVFVVRKYARDNHKAHNSTRITYRNMKRFDEEAFKQSLQEAPWDTAFVFDDIDDIVHSWEVIFNSILDSHCPWRVKRVKQDTQAPWMTKKVMKQLHTRDHLLKMARLSDDSDDWSKYRAARNYAVSMIRSAKRDFYATSFHDNKNNPRAIWKSIKTLTGANRNTDAIKKLDVDGRVIEESSEMSEQFNCYFSSIADKLRNQLCHVNYDLSKLINFVASRKDPDVSFLVPAITSAQVSAIMMKISSHKATGIDGISARLLRIGMPAIAPCIARLINLSMSTGKFPTRWKTAKVTPLFKGGALSDPSNYRPISVLPVLSKIIELHMYNSLYAFLTEQNLIYSRQSGFRKHHSTETALIKIVDELFFNLDRNKVSGLVLVDYAKAFNMVDHELLLKKLEVYGVKNQELNWCQSYLSDRKQVVCLDGNKSSVAFMRHGVPQGSILGPLFFILFINDLPLHVSGTIDLYADDTTISASADVNNIPSLQSSLKTSFGEIQQWAMANKLPLNESKTKVLTVTGKRLAPRIQQHASVILGTSQKALANVDCVSLLGLNIDSTLSFNAHADKVCKKLALRIAILRKIRTYLPLPQRIQYYNSIISPVMSYVSAIWSNCDKELLYRVFKLQKRAARVILYAERMAPSVELFNRLKWIPFYEKCKIDKASIMFKRIHGALPSYLNEHIPINNSRHSRTTRYSNFNVLCPRYNRETEGGRTFLVTGTKIWNEIPLRIRMADSIRCFKHNMWTNIFSQQQFLSHFRV